MMFRAIPGPAPERTMGNTQYGAGCGRLRCYCDRIGGIGWCGVHRLDQPAAPAWLGCPGSPARGGYADSSVSACCSRSWAWSIWPAASILAGDSCWPGERSRWPASCCATARPARSCSPGSCCSSPPHWSQPSRRRTGSGTRCWSGNWPRTPPRPSDAILKRPWTSTPTASPASCAASSASRPWPPLTVGSPAFTLDGGDNPERAGRLAPGPARPRPGQEWGGLAWSVGRWREPGLVPGGLEQLDRVAGRVLDQDLPAAHPGDDVVAEPGALSAQRGHQAIKIADFE